MKNVKVNHINTKAFGKSYNPIVIDFNKKRNVSIRGDQRPIHVFPGGPPKIELELVWRRQTYRAHIRHDSLRLYLKTKNKWKRTGGNHTLLEAFKKQLKIT